MRSARWWYIAALWVLIAATCCALFCYPLFPDPLPVHWGPSGHPDRFTAKTPVSVGLVIGVAPAISLVVGAGAAALTAGMAADKTPRAVAMNHAMQPVLGQFTLALTASTALFPLLALLFDALMPWVGWGALTAILGVCVYIVWAAAAARRTIDIHYPPTTYKPDALKWGVVYWDPNDSRTLVEIDSANYTFNFARPGSWLVLLLLLAPVLLVTVLVIAAD